MPPRITRIPSDEGAGGGASQRSISARSHLRLVFFRGAGLCVLWMGLGLYLIALAVHSTDETLGAIAFWSGLLVGNGGIFVTLMVTYSRALEEGWL